MDAWEDIGESVNDLTSLPNEVLPQEGYELPVAWGSLWKELVNEGVIDLAKFEEVTRLTPEQKRLLTDGSQEKIVINRENSHFVVNMLWTLGLGQESSVYTEGPLGKEYKNEQANFASTGGWTLSRGDAVTHLGRHAFMPLTPEQHNRVGEIARHVYRPCCGNHTWFPDCNHGMAALAAIEMMVLQGLSDEDIYRHVLALNSFWFPDAYTTVATHFARQGTEWSNVDAKEVLGSDYSSSQGYAKVAQAVGPLPYKSASSGGSCGA